MIPPAPSSEHTQTLRPRSTLFRVKDWWRGLPANRQDRLAALGPLLSVMLFLFTIVAALVYFTLDEMDREQEAVTRDVEYAQKRLRLRLMESQEQLMRVARNIGQQEITPSGFRSAGEMLRFQFPELRSVTWLDARGQVIAAHNTPNDSVFVYFGKANAISHPEAANSFQQLRQFRLPTYSAPVTGADKRATFLLFLPLDDELVFKGSLMAEYDIDNLLQLGVPDEVMASYAVALLNNQGTLLSGSLQFKPEKKLLQLPWMLKPRAHETEVSPVGHGLVLRASGYRTDKNTLGNALFWLVGALSILTVWMLVGNFRHTRRRIAAQRALVAETNLRRAMENSMLTGMKAYNMHGRLIYVNPAFCSMTGWSDSELLNSEPPYPFWPETEQSKSAAPLHEEMLLRSSPTGHEAPVKRRDGSQFQARVYISPLIDPSGVQTGWMTSITDITEPKRIREELTAAHERFTTVMDSLDATISVAPLGSLELLFANKMYRIWFGTSGQGHRNMIDQASALPLPANTDGGDQVDSLAGLPTDTLVESVAENTEVYLPELGKWLEMRTRYLTWVDGRLAQMVIATDITARHQAEEQAARQAERAESASRLITMGEMASSVAHELNQPLTAISNYCSGMIARIQKQQISNADLLTALEKTAKQAQRAGQIIQRIRAFVKRSEPNPTLSDVAQMVTNATELAEIDLRRHMVRLNTYMATRLPALMVDPILIEQVLINLLKNAGESILQAQRPAGQRHIELCITPKKIDDHSVIEFSVRDNGTGVPQEQLGRIYDAFYSTKTEGMGIGLKLCRSIVESHHGRLQARNLYNGEDVTGCEFSFWIPVPVPPQP